MKYGKKDATPVKEVYHEKYGWIANEHFLRIEEAKKRRIAKGSEAK
jgi:hypothetical protein